MINKTSPLQKAAYEQVHTLCTLQVIIQHGWKACILTVNCKNGPRAKQYVLHVVASFGQKGTTSW